MGHEGGFEDPVLAVTSQREERVAAGEHGDCASRRRCGFPREVGRVRLFFPVRIVVCGYDCPTSDRNVKRNRDEAQMSKLQQLGMNSTEEAKLMAMRDYILKLARAISR